MDDTLRPRGTAYFLRSEGAFQEVDHWFGAQRMQIGLDVGRTFPFVVPFTARGDVPEIAGVIFYCGRTFAIGLIYWLVNGHRARLQWALVDRRPHANSNAKSPASQDTPP